VGRASDQVLYCHFIYIILSVAILYSLYVDQLKVIIDTAGYLTGSLLL